MRTRDYVCSTECLFDFTMINDAAKIGKSNIFITTLIHVIHGPQRILVLPITLPNGKWMGCLRTI